MPNAPHISRSTEFLAGDGGQCRLLNVLDDLNRERLGIEVECSLPAERMIPSLDRIIEWRGKPGTIRVDDAFEYISAARSD